MIFSKDLIVPGVTARPCIAPGPGLRLLSVQSPEPGSQSRAIFPGLPGPGASVVTAGTRGTLCVTTS